MEEPSPREEKSSCRRRLNVYIQALYLAKSSDDFEASGHVLVVGAHLKIDRDTEVSITLGGKVM